MACTSRAAGDGRLRPAQPGHQPPRAAQPADAESAVKAASSDGRGRRGSGVGDRGGGGGGGRGAGARGRGMPRVPRRVWRGRGRGGAALRARLPPGLRHALAGDAQHVPWWVGGGGRGAARQQNYKYSFLPAIQSPLPLPSPLLLLHCAVCRHEMPAEDPAVEAQRQQRQQHGGEPIPASGGGSRPTAPHPQHQAPAVGSGNLADMLSSLSSGWGQLRSGAAGALGGSTGGQQQAAPQPQPQYAPQYAAPYYPPPPPQ